MNEIYNPHEAFNDAGQSYSADEDRDPFADDPGEAPTDVVRAMLRPAAPVASKRFYSNTASFADGEPGYYGTGMVDCSYKARSQFIWATATPDQVVNGDDPDDERYINPETGEPFYAFECPTVADASALCDFLNSVPNALAQVPDIIALFGKVEEARQATRREAIREFHDAVMRRADETMRQTNRVEGAHYNALKVEFEKEFQPK